MPEFDINKETEEIKKLYGDRFNKSVEEYLTGEELREEANRILDIVLNQEQVDMIINTPSREINPPSHINATLLSKEEQQKLALEVLEKWGNDNSKEKNNGDFD